ncbi:MAG: alpha/beta hydrolase [Candidatus Limnocylindrales bacterium]
MLCDWGPRAASRLVLLLHGVAGNAHIWDAAASRLRSQLGDSVRVVALDGRDGGLTEHPPTGYTPDDFGADLVAVHDALGGLPLTLVGHSRGGWLAAWFAERHAGGVERLVLVDPARLSFESGVASDRFFKRVLDGLGPFPSEIAALEWARSEDRDADWNSARQAGFLANFRRQADGSLVGHLPSHAVAQLRRDVGEDPVGPFLDRIACPTLLLVGARQSPERIQDKLRYASAIRDCRVVELAATHFIHTDLPTGTAREIASFVLAGTGREIPTAPPATRGRCAPIPRAPARSSRVRNPGPT